jgi:beta-N-acetylhexosaminidase
MPSFDFDLSGLQSLISSGIGGVLFLGTAQAPPDLGSRIAAAVSGAPPGGSPLVMADEEGGGIQRLSGVVSAFPWPRTIAATMTPAQTEALGLSVGTQMRQAGVDVDLAPVLDVDGGDGPNAADADGFRSFSTDPSIAAQQGVAFMQGLQHAGVIPVVKHFPGLGGAADTDDAPAATQPLSDLRTTGLPPFQAAIQAGAPAVMISNATVPGLTTLPASLSSSVIQGVLGDQLGFKGLVLTDSLSAAAISDAGYSVPQAAVAAITAGADQVLFSSTSAQQTTEQVIDAIAAANASGSLSTERLNQAVDEVIHAKGVNLCSVAPSP